MFPKQRGGGYSFGIWLSSVWISIALVAFRASCQVSGPASHIPLTETSREVSPRTSIAASNPLISSEDHLAQWQGLPVRGITFTGIARDRISSLENRLPQGIGSPLDREKVAASLRQVFATGLFDSVEVDGKREGDGVSLVFEGAPRMFIGTVTVDGAKGATVNTQLQRATRMNSGTRFSKAKMTQALEQMELALSQDGYREAAITYDFREHPSDQLIDIAFHVVSGPQARVGK